MVKMVMGKMGKVVKLMVIGDGDIRDSGDADDGEDFG